MADTYYAEELTAVPFGAMSKSLSTMLPGPVAFAFAAFFKLRGLMGWPLKPTYAVGGLDSEREVTYDGLPPQALSRWAPILEDLRDCGFQPLRYTIGDTIGEKEQAAACFLDGSGSTIATLEWMRMRGGEGIEERTPLEFNSYADADPEIMTGLVTRQEMALADMLRLDFVDLLILPDDHRPLEVYQRHSRRTQGRSFYQMTPEAALMEHKKRTERRFQWAFDKGLLRLLKPNEIARLRQMWLD